MRKFIMTVAVFLCFTTYASAFIGPLLLIGGVTFLVGKGLANEARDVVRSSIAEANKRIEDRINQAGDRADATVKLAAKEAKALLSETEKALLGAIDRAAGQAKEVQAEIFKNLANERVELFKQVDAAILRLEVGAINVQNQFFNNAEKLWNGVALDAEATKIKMEELVKEVKAGWLASKRRPSLTRVFGSHRTYQGKGEYSLVLIGQCLGKENDQIAGGVSPVEVRIPGKNLVLKQVQRPNREFVREITIPVDIANSFVSMDEAITYVPITVSIANPDRKERTEIDTTLVILPRFPVSYRFWYEKGKRRECATATTPGRAFIDEETVRAKEQAKSLGLDPTVFAAQRSGMCMTKIMSRLPFGTSEIDLPEGATFHSLEVTWFTGEKATLHHTGVKAALGVSVQEDPNKPGRFAITVEAKR